jgi:hypothetical protein
MKMKNKEQGIALLLTTIITAILTASIAFNINNINELNCSITKFSHIA